MRLIIAILLFALSRSSVFAEEPPGSGAIQTYIFEHLPESGVLKQNKNGFVYVDIDDDYIHKLIGFIQNNGFHEPPYFAGDHFVADPVGAHISVIYAAESVGPIKECGNTIYFKPKSCRIVEPPSFQDQEFYVLTVESPALDRIRKKYGLPKQKYPFHITIGVKQKEQKAS